MQPNYPQPSQPSVDPFAFLNETRKPNPFTNLINGSSSKNKLLMGGAILLVVVLLIVGLKAVFGGSGSVNLPSLMTVLSEQQELSNLATSGSQNSVSQSYQNFAYTSLASTTTDQTKLTKLLGLNGIKINPKNYTLQPSVDADLSQAQQQSNYDPVFRQAMQEQLQYYQTDLSRAYNLTKSDALRGYLTTDYKDTSLLITMLGASSG